MSESESWEESGDDSDYDDNHEPSYDDIEDIISSIDDEKALQLWNDRSDPNWFDHVCHYLRSRTILASELAQFSSGYLAQTLGEQFKEYGY
jgi:hypothetical protein